MVMKQKTPVFTQAPAQLDSNNLARMFVKSDLTILNWRKFNGLPHVRILNTTKYNIRYDINDVLDWAVDNKKKVDPDMIPKELISHVRQDLLQFINALGDVTDSLSVAPVDAGAAETDG